MTVFLSGGAKNGKSTLAQQLAVKLSGEGKRYYVATMIPTDEEDYDRIRRHVADRAGLGFETVECEKNMLSCLDRADKNGTFLVDSITQPTFAFSKGGVGLWHNVGFTLREVKPHD